jgi:hypothetical protein
MHLLKPALAGFFVFGVCTERFGLHLPKSLQKVDLKGEKPISGRAVALRVSS